MSVLRSKPVWLFVAISLGLNVSLPALIDGLDISNGDTEIKVIAGMMGIVSGEIAFVVIVSGLTCRTWLGGFLWGLAISSVGFLALFVGGSLVNSMEFDEAMGICLLPGFLMAATAPLFGFRLLRQWRLVLPGQITRQEPPLRIADLFSFVAIAAAALVLLRAPMVIWESDAASFWRPVLIACGILFVVGLMILPLATWFAFGIQPRAKSWWRLAGLALAVFLCMLLGAQCFFPWSSSWAERWEPVPFLVSFLAGALGVMYFHLLLLSRSGVTLVRLPRSAEQAADAAQAIAQQRRRTLRRMAIAICVTTIVSISLAALQAWRRARDRENARLQAIAESLGGSLVVYQRRVTGIVLGPSAHDDSLDQFRACSHVESIRVLSPAITDAGLARLRHFPQVETLELQGTRITDEGLECLRQMQKLIWVRLQNSAITGSGLRRLPDTSRLGDLNLDGSVFGDAGCAELPRFQNLGIVSLRGTQVTDQGFRHLSEIPNLSHLDLTDTKVSGRGIQGYHALVERLVLDGTPLDDATLAGPVIPFSIEVLSLARTRITDEAVNHLQPFHALHTLGASHTAITDEGVRGLSGLTSLQVLDLSDTPVKGVGFESWPAPGQLSELKLNGTAVDDQGIRHLRPFARLQTLGLARTAITDVGLRSLAMLTLKKLDVSGSKVTAQGILASGLTGLESITLSAEQCSSSEAEQLSLRRGVEVTIAGEKEPVEREVDK